MSQVVGHEEVVRQRVRALYAPVRVELDRVEAILQAELRDDDPFVDELARHGFQIGGKRLRPALLLLSAKAAGAVREEHLTLAAVVEMIHTATLVHDDVLDEAELRRHLETVNARHDNQASVLLGDYLFSQAFYLASTTGSAAACRTIGQATNRVCGGELRQIHQQGNLELDEAEYLAIVEAKTAELTACCCALGAEFAGADEAARARLESYGRNLGIAFQIADDLLDLTGDEEATGKSLGSDVAQCKATLPLIRGLELADDATRRELLRLCRGEGDPRPLLVPILERLGALDYAAGQARNYSRRAADALGEFESSPALDVLRRLTEFVVNRRQ